MTPGIKATSSKIGGIGSLILSKNPSNTNATLLLSQTNENNSQVRPAPPAMNVHDSFDDYLS